MHVRRIPASDLVALVLVRSPIFDVVASLRVLRSTVDARHDRWRAWARRRLDGLDLDVLLALVPPSGHLADVLTPPPVHERSFERELEVVAASPPAVMLHDVAILAEQRGGSDAILARLANDPEQALAATVEQLRAYRQRALEPVWSRIDRLAEADLDWRLRRFAEEGPRGVLASIHPRLTLINGDAALEVRCAAPMPSTSGVTFVPSAFAWPDLLVRDVNDGPLVIAYAPRGVGAMWQQHDERGRSGTEAVLGRTRAQLLRSLALPATTAELADELHLAPSTVSAHLQALLDARLLTRHRRGRFVRYARTTVADEWLAAGADPAS